MKPKNYTKKIRRKTQDKIIIEAHDKVPIVAFAIANVVKIAPIAAFFGDNEFADAAKKALSELMKINQANQAVASTKEATTELCAAYFNDIAVASALSLISSLQSLCEIPEGQVFDTAHSLLKQIEKDIEVNRQEEANKLLN
jgi:ATP-dependent protease HslVU (ClpYQ) peptidase subunit